MYTELSFQLPAMQGLSEKQIAAHLKLYAGYVKNTNTLLETVKELKQDSAKNAVALSELTRRFGFEWNGMRLHENYFSSLGGSGAIDGNGKLAKAIAETWGSIDAWVAEFKAMGVMRGIGWVLLVHDETTDHLHNVWVSDHELGHLAGAKILLAMDVWEHAYLLDYLPAERGNYITAFFANLNFNAVEARY
ncbi:superoxide dismutase [Patescibacteria group bacterium]|nr:superoxide dismutase [Patescibacteria group bacterium]